MGKWFNENMSSDELHLALFSLSKQQLKENEAEIRKEYAEVLPIITKRENDLAEEGWML